MPLLSGRNWEALLAGARITVELTALAAVLGTVIGVLGGVALLSGSRSLRAVMRVYVEVFRGVSALILLFWTAFAVPQLFEYNISTFTAAVVALGTNMGAYASELARGAIAALPRGQTEASVAIHLSAYQRLRRVILPQAFITMLPPYGNLLVEVLKATALVSLLGLDDIMREAQILRNNRAAIGATSPEIYLGAFMVYLVIAQVIVAMVTFAERRLSRGMDVGRSATRVR